MEDQILGPLLEDGAAAGKEHGLDRLAGGEPWDAWPLPSQSAQGSKSSRYP